MADYPTVTKTFTAKDGSDHDITYTPNTVAAPAGTVLSPKKTATGFVATDDVGDATKPGAQAGDPVKSKDEFFKITIPADWTGAETPQSDWFMTPPQGGVLPSQVPTHATDAQLRAAMATGWEFISPEAAAAGMAEVTQAELDTEKARIASLEASQGTQDTAIADKADQADIDAETARIDALVVEQGTQDTAIADKAAQADLDVEKLRIDTNVSAIATEATRAQAEEAMKVDKAEKATAADITTGTADKWVDALELKARLDAIDGGAGDPWEGGKDYAVDEVFSHRVTQATAVDINGGTLTQNNLYNFAYKTAKTSAATATLAEIALWDTVSDVDAAANDAVPTAQFISANYDWWAVVQAEGIPQNFHMHIVNELSGSGLQIVIDPTKAIRQVERGMFLATPANGGSISLGPLQACNIWYDDTTVYFEKLDGSYKGFKTQAELTAIPQNGLSAGDYAIIDGVLWTYDSTLTGADTEAQLAPNDSVGAGRWMTPEAAVSGIVAMPADMKPLSGRVHKVEIDTTLDLADVPATTDPDNEYQFVVFPGITLTVGADSYTNTATTEQTYAFRSTDTASTLSILNAQENMASGIDVVYPGDNGAIEVSKRNVFWLEETAGAPPAAGEGLWYEIGSMGSEKVDFVPLTPPSIEVTRFYSVEDPANGGSWSWVPEGEVFVGGDTKYTLHLSDRLQSFRFDVYDRTRHERSQRTGLTVEELTTGNADWTLTPPPITVDPVEAGYTRLFHYMPFDPEVGYWFYIDWRLVQDEYEIIVQDRHLRWTDNTQTAELRGYSNEYGGVSDLTIRYEASDPAKPTWQANTAYSAGDVIIGKAPAGVAETADTYYLMTAVQDRPNTITDLDATEWTAANWTFDPFVPVKQDIIKTFYAARPDPATLLAGSQVSVVANSPDPSLNGTYTVTGPVGGAGTGYSADPSTGVEVDYTDVIDGSNTVFLDDGQGGFKLAKGADITAGTAVERLVYQRNRGDVMSFGDLQFRVPSSGVSSLQFRVGSGSTTITNFTTKWSNQQGGASENAFNFAIGTSWVYFRANGGLNLTLHNSYQEATFTCNGWVYNVQVIVGSSWTNNRFSFTRQRLEGIKGDDGVDGVDGVDAASIDHISLTTGDSSPGTTDTYTLWADAGETTSLGTYDVPIPAAASGIQTVELGAYSGAYTTGRTFTLAGGRTWQNVLDEFQFVYVLVGGNSLYSSDQVRQYHVSDLTVQGRDMAVTGYMTHGSNAYHMRMVTPSATSTQVSINNDNSSMQVQRIKVIGVK